MIILNRGKVKSTNGIELSSGKRIEIKMDINTWGYWIITE